MDATALRAKYPKFTYEAFSHTSSDTEIQITFTYLIPKDFTFHHQLTLPLSTSTLSPEKLNELIFQLGLSLIPSYWKLTCSPLIEINAGHLNTEQLKFWHKLFIKGMGEYYYKNNIDFTASDFLTLTSPNAASSPSSFLPKPAKSQSILIPIGGGKDSIVTLELLKNHFPVTAFAINPHPNISLITKVTQTNLISITSTLDPLLLKLNAKGFLNGHVPVSAFYMFASLLTASLFNIPSVAFSNENSSNEGNTEYQGHVINHQYSKSAEFENDLSAYLSSFTPVSVFSFLRPLNELQIAKLFSRFPQYFAIFTSCNKNFKLNPSAHPQGSLWCKTCPKCVSTALLLTPFLPKQKIISIMGAYPPDIPENQTIVKELLGELPIKPFECVLSRAEAQAAHTGSDLEKLLSDWQTSSNLPSNFASVLRQSL